jgi:8-oxo-dGTP diphosphatase
MSIKVLLDHTIKAQLIDELRQDRVAKVVVGAVIKKEKEVLLLERLPTEEFGGLIELPSGTVEAGEQFDAALVREVAEETALQVTSFGRYLGAFDYLSGSGKHTRQLNFEVFVQEGEVVIQPAEHKAFYWINPSDYVFGQLNISDEVRLIIRAGMVSGV